MKQFFEKHIVLFGVFVIMIALASNLLTGLLQSLFTEYGVMYYLSEAMCKSGIAVIPLCMMRKWGYTKKSDKKKIMSGFVLGLLFVLFFAPNLISLVLINPILFQVQWTRLIALTLAMFSIGLLEESAIRGVVLPLLCEKWKEKKNPFLKAAFASSLLFACIHLNWSVRYFLTYGSLSWEYLSGNLYQVYYTFCFGILAAGICMYCRSIWPLVFWHGMCDWAAELVYGILPAKTVGNYSAELSLQNVFDKYGIMEGCSFGAEMVYTFVNILFLVIGVLLICKAEKE